MTGCLEAFNITYDGDPISIGYFNGSIGSTGFNEGIVLTSGSAASAEGPNNSGSTGFNSSGGSDIDLQALIPGYTINDAAILEFDFIPASDSLQFDFIFGSDEYPEWVASDYNDVFRFSLSGPGITGPYSNNSINIALIPGTAMPVTIDNINAGTNAAYYISDSYGGDMEYDGATIPITAKATVQACETYHIKIAIGDAGDSSYDSGVFLNAKSFISGADFIIDLFNPWYQTSDTYEGCQNYAVFSRVDSTDTNQDINIGLSIAGTATMGTDYSNIPDTVTIPAGQISDTLIINTYIDGITEGNEFLIFTYTNGCPCTPVTSHDTIWIRDEIDAQINLTNSGPICEGDTASLSISFNPSLDLSLIDWTWQFNGSTQQSVEVSPNTSTTYTLEVNYPCITEYYTTDLVVHENVDATINPVADLCENEPAITLTATDAGGTWSGNGVTGNTFNPAIAGLGDHLVTYIISNANCSDTATITIHVDEVLDPTIDPIEIQCRTDDAFLLTAATPGGIWTGPGVVGGQNLNPTSAGVGIHTIYYTLINGACTSVDSTEIEIVNDVDATIHNVPNLCVIDAPIDLEANWHTGVWSGTGITDAALGIFDPAIAGLGDHEIEFQVGTGGTCSDVDTIMIHVNAMPDASITAPGPFCFPGDLVTLTANTAGGTWSGTGISDPANGIFNPSLTGVGTTQVIYTVGSGACFDSDTIDIIVNPAPTVDLGTDQAHCDYDVPIALDAGAGFSYNWATGETSQIINPATTGNYSVVITDANGCTATDNMDLIVNPAPTVDLGTDISSCEYNFPLTANGPASMTSYSRSTGESTQSIEIINAGNYSLLVTNSHGCTASSSINYNKFYAPLVELGANIHVCENESPVIINAGDGSAYSWNTGEEGQIIAVSSTGEYTVVTTDQHGCTGSDNIFVELDPMPEPGVHSVPDQCINGSEIALSSDYPGGIWSGQGITDPTSGLFSPSITGIGEATVTYAYSVGMCNATEQVSIIVRNLPPISIMETTRPTCHGYSNGQIEISSPGTNNPQFIWPNWGSGSILSGIPTGTYTILVEDDYGCVNTMDIYLSEPSPLESVITKSDVSCPAASDGSASVLAGGGTAPYKYRWNTGATDAAIYNLCGGIYTVIVEDYNECEISKSADIYEPPAINFNTNVTPVECGTSHGAINVIATGGHDGFAYQWDQTELNGTSLTDLSAGAYILTATDDHGCTAQTSIIVPAIGNIDVIINELNPVTCYGYNSGQLEALVTSSGGSFDYQWNNGAHSQITSSLYSGNYQVTINDNYGCSGIASHFLSSPDEILVSFSTNPVTCHGDGNGITIAHASGGNAPYNYQWNNEQLGDSLINISGGIYYLSVSDMNNCSATAHTYVHEPSSPLSANLLMRDITCYGFNDGKAIVEGYGGTSPYAYEWSTSGLSSNNQEITNLREGFYQLEITDNNGCLFDTMINITEPVPMFVDYTYESPSCIGNDDGYIEFEVIGGVEPYSFQADIATQNLPYFHGLYEGTYHFTITDGNGCKNQLDKITLIDNPEECIRIPDAFTPNSDGTNDTWIIENLGMFPNAIVQVFNRWGQEVYFGYANSEPWDGTFDGNHLPTGSYIYIVDLHNQSKPNSGTVTIVH